MISITFVHSNVSFGQAIDLIPIQTGNATLYKGLPGFYDCIDDKIEESKGVEVDPFFEKDPSEHEVTLCYNEALTFNSDVQSSTDYSQTSDIERFNSLFGFTS